MLSSCRISPLHISMTLQTLNPINSKDRPLLHRIAQEEIKAFILRSALKAGDPLPSEGDLAERLNISRNSLREAVRSLEALGIIEARPGAGLFVRDFSFDPILNGLAYGLLSDLNEVNDMIEVRFYLEVGMAEHAVAAVTDEQVERLREILARMYAAAKNGIYSAEDDRAFHQVLWEKVGNTILPKIIDVFWIILHHAQANGAVPNVGDPIDTYRRHLELANALEKRDLKTLQTAMTHHWGYPEIKIQGQHHDGSSPP